MTFLLLALALAASPGPDNLDRLASALGSAKAWQAVSNASSRPRAEAGMVEPKKFFCAARILGIMCLTSLNRFSL